MEQLRTYPPYRILCGEGSTQIIEKKSRFIATLLPVKTEDEAALFVEATRKKYWDASHNCYAYILGEAGKVTKCYDDGEPAGTAGKPMLEALLGAGLTNAAAVVTRYFGGTLLGTGGLIRAYTRALKEGIAAASTAQMIYGARLKLTADYNDIGKVQYILGQQGKKMMDTVYSDVVCLQLYVPTLEEQMLIRELTDATGGRTEIEVLERCYFMDK